MLIAISDPDDLRIEAYRAVRERDLLGRQRRFIAEGEVVLRVLLRQQSRFEIESLLLGEGRVEGLNDELHLLAPEVPVSVRNRPVMGAIGGFPIHRGILAVARRPMLPPADALLAN